MKGTAVRLLRVLLLFPALAIGMLWLFVVVVPVFVFFGGDAAEREVTRGYWLADWCLGMDAFRP